MQHSVSCSTVKVHSTNPALLTVHFTPILIFSNNTSFLRTFFPVNSSFEVRNPCQYIQTISDQLRRQSHFRRSIRSSLSKYTRCIKSTPSHPREKLFKCLTFIHRDDFIKGLLGPRLVMVPELHPQKQLYSLRKLIISLKSLKNRRNSGAKKIDWKK